MVVDELSVEQLKVGRHIRIRSAIGNLNVHASGTALGVWLQSADGRRDENMLSAYVVPGRTPALALWPSRKFWGPRPRQRMPFAISGDGLQVPHPDGTVTILPLEQLAEIVRTLANR